jgi:ABC-type multidrug transport system ATPase subunit
MFRLSGEMAFQDAGTLSGGEKTKLALAQLVAGKKNLLMLDEPTNNLDPPSRTAIAEALAGWPGSMILVSHDIEFVEALAPQRVLMMPDGTLALERRPELVARVTRVCFGGLERTEDRPRERRERIGTAAVRQRTGHTGCGSSWATAVAVKGGRSSRSAPTGRPRGWV